MTQLEQSIKENTDLIQKFTAMSRTQFKAEQRMGISHAQQCFKAHLHPNAIAKTLNILKTIIKSSKPPTCLAQTQLSVQHPNTSQTTIPPPQGTKCSHAPLVLDIEPNLPICKRTRPQNHQEDDVTQTSFPLQTIQSQAPTPTPTITNGSAPPVGIAEPCTQVNTHCIETQPIPNQTPNYNSTIPTIQSQTPTPTLTIIHGSTPSVGTPEPLAQDDMPCNETQTVINQTPKFNSTIPSSATLANPEPNPQISGPFPPQKLSPIDPEDLPPTRLLPHAPSIPTIVPDLALATMLSIPGLFEQEESFTPPNLDNGYISSCLLTNGDRIAQSHKDPLSNMWPAPFLYENLLWPSHEHAIQAKKIEIVKDFSLNRAHHILCNDAETTGYKAKTFTNTLLKQCDRSSWHLVWEEIVHNILLCAGFSDHQFLHCLLDPRIKNFKHTLPHPNPQDIWSGEQNLHGKLLLQVWTQILDFATYIYEYNTKPFMVQGLNHIYTGKSITRGSLPNHLDFVFRHNFPPAPPPIPKGKGKSSTLKLVDIPQSNQDTNHPTPSEMVTVNNSNLESPPTNPQSTNDKILVDPSQNNANPFWPPSQWTPTWTQVRDLSPPLQTHGPQVHQKPGPWKQL